jgi:N utilization substance protein A
MNPDASGTQEIRNLFDQNVPEIASALVEIRGIARDRGFQSVVAVASKAPGIDTVSVCVGTRGSIMKSIVAELGGENLTVVRWDDSVKSFAKNLFAPMFFVRIDCDDASHQVTAVLRSDSQILPSRTVALHSRLLRDLTGWVINFEIEG